MADGQINDPTRPGFAIGAALKEARQRLGMDVKEAEERTKIRARYLRALEAEDWEALPGPAYVRGFLRTYGGLLGLDGAMLADEYRRRFESAAQPGSGSAGEPLRAGSRASRSSGPSRGILAGGVLAAIVVLLVVLGALGGGEEEPERADGPLLERQSDRDRRQGGRKDDRKPRFRLAISPAAPMTVCLASGGEALIDSQVLAADAVETFGGKRRFRLDLVEPGELTLRIDGSKHELTGTGEQSFEITADGPDEIGYAGPDCP